jgi:cysteine synthase B
MAFIEDFVGNTPLVELKRLPYDNGGKVFLKLEGNNPAGSVKDRPALSMIKNAELRGEIKPGDTLIEATSGNTGIALAMAAAMMGYKMILIMPENQSIERRQTMQAFGAEIISTSQAGSMELARDTAKKMEADGKGKILDQFANPDNPMAHYKGTGPEIWKDTNGKITHFVSSMGTTGTIVGTSRFLKEQSKSISIIGVQPEEGAQIPGIRKWPKEYIPTIFTDENIDQIKQVSQKNAEETTRRLAREEGIFCGASTGGALYVALELAKQNPSSIIVSIACDRGDRYLSTGLFPAA